MDNPEAMFMDKDTYIFFLEQFIDPLKSHGFIFEDYLHANMKNSEFGTHIFLFDYPFDALPDMEAVTEICTQDDDSQPEATFRMYFGTLMLYVPYFP